MSQVTLRFPRASGEVEFQRSLAASSAYHKKLQGPPTNHMTCRPISIQLLHPNASGVVYTILLFLAT